MERNTLVYIVITFWFGYELGSWWTLKRIQGILKTAIETVNLANKVKNLSKKQNKEK